MESRGEREKERAQGFWTCKFIGLPMHINTSYYIYYICTFLHPPSLIHPTPSRSARDDRLARFAAQIARPAAHANCSVRKGAGEGRKNKRKKRKRREREREENKNRVVNRK